MANGLIIAAALMLSNEIFFYLAVLKKTDMAFQLVTGRPDTADHLVFTTTFTHNNVFYKAALAESISWEGHLIGTYDVLLQSGKGTQASPSLKTGNIGEPEKKLNRSGSSRKTWWMCLVR
jgi:hypothetical protein